MDFQLLASVDISRCIHGFDIGDLYLSGKERSGSPCEARKNYGKNKEPEDYPISCECYVHRRDCCIRVRSPLRMVYDIVTSRLCWGYSCRAQHADHLSRI